MFPPVGPRCRSSSALPSWWLWPDLQRSLLLPPDQSRPSSSGERSGCRTRPHRPRDGPSPPQWSGRQRRLVRPRVCGRRRWRARRSSPGTQMSPGLSRGCGQPLRRDDGGFRTTAHWCGDRRRPRWRLRQARSRSDRPSAAGRLVGSTVSPAVQQRGGEQRRWGRAGCVWRVSRAWQVVLR